MISSRDWTDSRRHSRKYRERFGYEDIPYQVPKETTVIVTEPTLSETLAEFKEVKNACKVCDVMDALSEDDAITLEDYLGSGIITQADIVDALAKHGFSVSETTLRRHRRKCMGL